VASCLLFASFGCSPSAPKDSSAAELQSPLDEKVAEEVDEEAVRTERAKKVLKVIESAEAHNRRLKRTDDRLFNE